MEIGLFTASYTSLTKLHILQVITYTCPYEQAAQVSRAAAALSAFTKSPIPSITKL